MLEHKGLSLNSVMDKVLHKAVLAVPESLLL